MYLKPTKSMSLLTAKYSSDSLYCRNSSSHSYKFNGGKTLCGSQRVIERPDFVSLVCPPITTIANIEALTMPNQAPTNFSLPCTTYLSFLTLNMIGFCLNAKVLLGLGPMCVENNLFIINSLKCG